MYGKIQLSIPHKLALLQAGIVSRALLFAVYLFLAFNSILLISGNVMPIWGIIIAILLLLLEWARKKPLAKEAIIFTFWRCILNLVFITSFFIVNFFTQGYTYSFFAIFCTLGILSFYDAYCMLYGRLGLRFLASVAILKNRLKFWSK